MSIDWNWRYLIPPNCAAKHLAKADAAVNALKEYIEESVASNTQSIVGLILVFLVSTALAMERKLQLLVFALMEPMVLRC